MYRSQRISRCWCSEPVPLYMYPKNTHYSCRASLWSSGSIFDDRSPLPLKNRLNSRFEIPCACQLTHTHTYTHSHKIFAGIGLKGCLDFDVLSQCHYICIRNQTHTHTRIQTHTQINLLPVDPTDCLLPLYPGTF